MQVKDIEVPERQIIADMVIDEVILDNGKVTTDPVGNLSTNFTVNAQVILADKEYVCKVRGKIRNLKIIPKVGDRVIFDKNNNYISSDS